MNIISNDVLSIISDVCTESVSKTTPSIQNPNLEPEYFGNKLKSLRTPNLHRIIIAQMNINSIRLKFEALVNGVRGNVDILVYPKLKLMSFPLTQFLIEGFTAPYRLDGNGSGEGILVYIREDIPSKLIPTDFPNREGFFLELNLRKKKWVLCCSYNPHSNFIETHMESIGKVLDSHSDTTIKDFRDIYSFKNLIKDATCFKNPDKPKCIDLLLTNKNRSFQNSCVIDTGLSDFYKMTVTVLRSHLNKLGPKIIHYRDYKHFSNDAFRSELVTENGNLQNFNDLHSFLTKSKTILNRTE